MFVQICNCRLGTTRLVHSNNAQKSKCKIVKESSCNPISKVPMSTRQYRQDYQCRNDWQGYMLTTPFDKRNFRKERLHHDDHSTIDEKGRLLPNEWKKAIDTFPFIIVFVMVLIKDAGPCIIVEQTTHEKSCDNGDSCRKVLTNWKKRCSL